MSDNKRPSRRKAKQAVRPPRPAPTYPQVYETYCPELCVNSILINPHPGVFNGMCKIRRFRVTVEPIEEPIEVLRERLQHFWDNKRELGITHSSNIDAMHAAAKRLGMELKY